MNYTAISLLLWKMPTLTIAKFTNCWINDTKLQTSVKQLRATTTSSIFTPTLGMQQTILNFSPTCIVRYQCALMYFGCTKRFFSLSTQASIIVSIANPCVRCAKFFFSKNKQVLLSWSLARGYTILERRKKQFKMFLEMSIVQHAQPKSVFTFQRKNSNFYDCKKCKACSHSWIFLWRTKNQQLCCLVVMVHIALQKKRVATMKKQIRLLFWRNISSNHSQANQDLNKKNKSHSKYVIFLSTRQWLIQLIKKCISILILYIFSLQ